MDFLKVLHRVHRATAVILSHPFDGRRCNKRKRHAFRIRSLYRGFIPALSGSIAFRTLPFIAYNWSTRISTMYDFWTRHTAWRAPRGAGGGALRSAVGVLRSQGLSPSNVNCIGIVCIGYVYYSSGNMSVRIVLGIADVVSRTRLSYEGPLSSFIIGGGCSTTAWAIIYPWCHQESRTERKYEEFHVHISISARHGKYARSPRWRSMYQVQLWSPKCCCEQWCLCSIWMGFWFSSFLKLFHFSYFLTVTTPSHNASTKKWKNWKLDFEFLERHEQSHTNSHIS